MSSEQLRPIKLTGKVYCSAANCKNHRVKSSALKFYRFPNDENRCKIWIQNSGRKDLLDKNATELEGYQICSVHFEDSQFMNYKRDRLNWNAIPTLFNMPIKRSVGRPRGSSSKKVTNGKRVVSKSSSENTVSSSEKQIFQSAGINGTSKTMIIPLTRKPIAPKPSPETLALSSGKPIAQSAGNSDGNVIVLVPVSPQTVNRSTSMPFLHQLPGNMQQISIKGDSRTILVPINRPMLPSKASTSNETLKTGLGTEKPTVPASGTCNDSMVVLVPVSNQSVKTSLSSSTQPQGTSSVQQQFCTNVNSRSLLIPVHKPTVNTTDKSGNQIAVHADCTGNKKKLRDYTRIARRTTSLEETLTSLPIKIQDVRSNYIGHNEDVSNRSMHLPMNSIDSEASKKTTNTVLLLNAPGLPAPSNNSVQQSLLPNFGKLPIPALKKIPDTLKTITHAKPTCTCTCSVCKSSLSVLAKHDAMRKKINLYNMRFRRLKQKYDKLTAKKFEISPVQLKFELKRYISDDNAYEFILSQLHSPTKRKSTTAPRWNSQLKDMFLSMYRDSRRTYNMFLKVFDIPSKNSLLRHEKELKELLHLEKELSHIQDTEGMRSTAPCENKNMSLSSTVKNDNSCESGSDDIVLDINETEPLREIRCTDEASEWTSQKVSKSEVTKGTNAAFHPTESTNFIIDDQCVFIEIPNSVSAVNSVHENDSYLVSDHREVPDLAAEETVTVDIKESMLTQVFNSNGEVGGITEDEMYY